MTDYIQIKVRRHNFIECPGGVGEGGEAVLVA